LRGYLSYSLDVITKTTKELTNQKTTINIYQEE